jgi:hypothetical protein
MDALNIIDPEVKAIFESASSLEALIRAGKLAETYSMWFRVTLPDLLSEGHASSTHTA